ncbi:hypothetical protein IF1G_09699 [Cordyceps javanica]|uniref:Uncharacterized protein n=1 Tax=Cordyceps javanica TaxID=43265 RepID=A0A545VPG0_9HYPO|nr:hypothetical protein IF1G_09699 [Cordyceps javanica]TQW03583.1 hypothetical protein IF2G_08881 [Cordyceps javanica]
MALMTAGTLTGLAMGSPLQGRPKGWCQNADCSKVPAPYTRRGVVSVRDDRCQYSCHLRRVREAAEKRAKEAPVDLGIVPSAAEMTVPEPGSAEPSEEDKKKRAVEEINVPDELQAGSAAASIFGSSPGLFRRAGEAAPQVPIGQFDVAVTNIPRRSEGPCKFAVDASPKPEESGAGIVCLGSAGQAMMKGMTRGTVAMFAARLAVEYDRSCELTADTKAYVEGQQNKSVSPFDPSSTAEASAEVLGQGEQVFFLSCGAVFQYKPLAGSSGDAVAPAVRMVRDARGFVPLVAESIPASVFPAKKPNKRQEGETAVGMIYDASNPPPWLQAAQAEAAATSKP